MDIYGSKTKQTGFSVTAVLLVLFVFIAVVAASIVVYGHTKPSSANYTAATTANHETANHQIIVQTDPYKGWTTYTSPIEKASFEYPSDWSYKIVGSISQIELISPSKHVSIVWNAQIAGVGGACDTSVFPGSPEAKNSQLGACPYFIVLDTQQLTHADLTYVAGIETIDGTHYGPWFALQDSHGILKTGSYTGYLIFQGKHNNIIDASGRDTGPLEAKLAGGDSNQPPFDNGFGTETEEQAKSFFATPEARQAKLTLLSYAY